MLALILYYLYKNNWYEKQLTERKDVVEHIRMLSTLIKHIPGCVEYNLFYSDVYKRYNISFQGVQKEIDDVPLIDYVTALLLSNNRFDNRYQLTVTDIKESTPGNMNFSGFIKPVDEKDA